MTNEELTKEFISTSTQLAMHDQIMKNNLKAIDELKKEIVNIKSLTLSVHEIATEMKAMRKDMADVNVRLKAIEQKPSKRFETILTQVITLVTGLIFGIVVSKLGL